MDNMFIIMGLGNPGQKFENTRHNLGFRVLDEIRKEDTFSDFKFSQKFNADLSEGILNGEKTVLAKPHAFMNNSGKTAKLLVAFYMLPVSNLWIFHDDIDLPVGKMKIAQNRGSAGHKGVESIKKELKTNDFVRFRMGILPRLGKPKNVENFVLQKFNKIEERSLKNTIKNAVDAAKFALKENIEKSMSEFNK